MKIIILKERLVSALSSVEKSIGNVSNLPVLKSVKIDSKKGNNIVLTSTDLEIATEHKISGKVMETGSVAVPFDLFFNVVKNIKSQKINLELKDKKLFLDADNYNASFLCDDVEDYPIVPKIEEGNELKIKEKELTESLKKTLVATQYSDIRPEINGIFIYHDGKSIVTAGTDSFRLVEKKIRGEDFSFGKNEFKMTVPLKTVENYLRIFSNKKSEESDNMTVMFDENQIVFEQDDIKITSRLVDGNFPDYKSVIPKETKQEISINKKEIENAIKTTKSFSGQTNDVVLRSENKKVLEVFSESSSTGEGVYRLPTKTKGDFNNFSITFNWKYLLDGIKIFEDEEIVLGISEPEKPVVIKNPKDNNVIYIVMPIKG